MSTRKATKEFYTKSEAQEEFRLWVGLKSQADVARDLKITPQLLNDVLGKRRALPEAAMQVLGLEDAGRCYRRVGVKKSEGRAGGVTKASVGFAGAAGVLGGVGKAGVA